MTVQQKQTQVFFERFASDWESRSKNKKIELRNTVQQRNNYVLNFIKKNKPKNFLDVGCGSGELTLMSAKYTKNSIGIDFSNSMIDLCNKKNKRKKVKFICDSFFNLNQKKNSFDLISANGFIEYISLDELFLFLHTCKNLLKKDGILVLSARNKLFNLFSLNNFTKSELANPKSTKILFEESLKITNLSLKKFIKLKSNLSLSKLKKQPKTTINVNIRHQFTPLQLIKLLNKFKFQVKDLYPINYHPVIPKNFDREDKNLRKISNYIIKKFPSIDMIPNSSAFMITAKCK